MTAGQDSKSPGAPVRIGVSACIMHADPTRNLFKGKTLLYAEESMLQWLMAEGALPVLLPRASGALWAKDLVEGLGIDGLILQGGADIDPRSYGETASNTVGPIDVVRDRFELDLLRAFVAARKPVFGVCRGMQLINVACGGNLHQDLCADGATSNSHAHADAYDQHRHPLAIEPGSWFSARYAGAVTGTVNSIHHQGIERLGEGLVIEARADDGVIEAVRGSGDGFLLGVQWHPEFHDGSDPRLLPADPLMQAFLDAAADRAEIARTVFDA